MSFNLKHWPIRNLFNNESFLIYKVALRNMLKIAYHFPCVYCNLADSYSYIIGHLSTQLSTVTQHNQITCMIIKITIATPFQAMKLQNQLSKIHSFPTRVLNLQKLIHIANQLAYIAILVRQLGIKSSRDEPILLFSDLFSFPAILFSLAYYAQYFARSCNILLKVQLYCQLLDNTYNTYLNSTNILLEYIDLFNPSDSMFCSVFCFHYAKPYIAGSHNLICDWIYKNRSKLHIW